MTFLTALLITAGSLFSAQCPDLSAAYFYHDAIYRELDVAELATMEYTPGEWQGYEAVGYEFGRHVTGKAGRIFTITPCGTFWAYAYETQEGDVLVFAFTDLERTCDSAGECCGNHHFAFAYVAAEEWARVTQ